MSNNKNTYTVYRHITPNGKIYVGITSINPKTRWHNGLGYRNNPHFYRAIQKYGWNNIKHEIMFNNLSKEEASFAERVCISTWDLTNPNRGYNINKGGITGDRMSNDTKKKLSDINRGKKLSQETKDKISMAFTGEKHPFYGKHHTEESRKKMSLRKSGCNHPNYGRHLSRDIRQKISSAHKGIKHSQKTIQKIYGANNHSARPVVALDKVTNVVVYMFDCIRDAERSTGIIGSNITACCRGKRKTAGGYVWKYKEDIKN